MNEESNKINVAFMEVVSKKAEGQDKKIAALEEKIKQMPDNTELFQNLVSAIQGLREDIKESRFSVEKLQWVSARLDTVMTQLSKPIETKMLHHHHIPKIIWITAGLFIVFALVCSGWYMTGSKLDSFIANDTKYRQLRLDTAQKSLQIYLDKVDSLYIARPDMRKIVLEKEQEYQLNFEKLQKAERLKAEAKELERAVKRKRKNQIK